MQETPLIDLSDGKMLEQGIFPSLAEDQQQLWFTSSNVEFQQLRAKKAVGFTAEADTDAIYALAQAFVGTDQRAYAATADKLFLYQSGAILQIGHGFGLPAYWSLETWGNFLIATNEVDPPQVWKNTLAPLVESVALGGLTGTRLGRKYRIFKKHKNHMLGYYGQSADFSSESDIETWEPDVANSAGGEFIRDLDSDIIAAADLGPDVAVYSGDSMVLQRYVGAPFYFGWEKAIAGIGAVSEYCVVSVGNLNYGMSTKGFWRTDGISFDYIDNPQINKWVKDRFYTPQGRRTVGLHDEENDTVKWWFLGSMGVIYGVGFNISKGSWTILNQPVTAASEKQVFDHALIGTRTSVGFLTGTESGNNPQVSYLETFPLHAGRRNNYKLWDMIRVNMEGSGLQIRFGFQDRPQDATSWGDWEDVADENFINYESPFMKVAFQSTEADVDWAITGFAIYGEITGYL